MVIFLRNSKSKRRAFELSYFLDGKSYDFYIQKVSRTEEEWTVKNPTLNSSTSAFLI
jgi:hypothetical protein